jgi:transcriptional regulator with XRE-family HTH domain
LPLFAFTMINNEDFAKRLQIIIDYYGESASSFAEKIGVQRSSISHILSARNKPSLEFILKIMSSFPEVAWHWLIHGTGSFPSTEIKSTIKTTVQNDMGFDSDVKKIIKEDVVNDKVIERIVIFYADGSFKNFQN